eukprot:scaffold22069_cov122-Isochrysis_galbana.AAC.8
MAAGRNVCGSTFQPCHRGMTGGGALGRPRIGSSSTRRPLRGGGECNPSLQPSHSVAGRVGWPNHGTQDGRIYIAAQLALPGVIEQPVPIGGATPERLLGPDNVEGLPCPREGHVEPASILDETQRPGTGAHAGEEHHVCLPPLVRIDGRNLHSVRGQAETTAEKFNGPPDLVSLCIVWGEDDNAAAQSAPTALGTAIRSRGPQMLASL